MKGQLRMEASNDDWTGEGRRVRGTTVRGTTRATRATAEMSTRDAARVYVASRLSTAEIRPSTAELFRSHLRGFVKFGPERGDGPVGRLGERHIRSWLAAMPRGVSMSTRRNRLATVRGFCDWLVRHRALEANPVRTSGIRFRDSSGSRARAVPKHLDHAEVRALYRELPDARAVALVTLMLQMGLRVGAVAGLRVDDVDLARGVLVARREHAKTAHDDRLKPMPDEAVAALRVYLAEHPPPGVDCPLLRSYTDPWAGLSGAWISKMIRGWMRDAGIYHRGRCAHALRHTMAVDMLDRTGDIHAVSQALDHARLESTRIYAGVLAMDRLRDKMAGRTYWRSAAPEPAGKLEQSGELPGSETDPGPPAASIAA